MKPIKYVLDGGLEKSDIEKMWDGALHLIENYGLKIPHDGILKIISNYDGVKINGDIVTFKPELVSKAIKAQDYSDWPKEIGPHNFGIISGAYVKNLIDIKDGSIRPANTQDLIDCTKLCDTYGMYGPPCVSPADVPTEMQRLLMYKASYEYSRTKGHGLFDVAGWLNPEEARIGKEMSEVANKDFRIDLWLISPFLAPKEGLAILYEFRNEPVDMNISTMPITGATGPINMIDSYVQCLGELFSGMALLYLINESKDKKGKIRTVVIDSIRAYPIDMRYGMFVYGSAEDAVGSLYQAQLNKHFGIPLVTKSLLTTSKLPDGHAAGEKAAHTMLGALSGATVFSNAGLLSVDEIYSVEQIVIDYEIVQYCKRVVDGYEFDESMSALDVIYEVGRSSSFMTHETTLAKYKKYLWDPDLFLHSSLKQWRKAGSKSTEALAREIALDRITKHEYTIEEDIKKELNGIYKMAEKKLCK